MPEHHPADDGAPLRAPASPGEIFRVFTRMALQGFGGVLAVAQHHLVERERWLGRTQFVELLSAGQVLPGPNVLNLALMFGDRQFGWRGALAAGAGLLLVPTLLVLLLAAFCTSFADWPAVSGALRGVGAVAAGLVIATGLKLLPTLARNPLGRAPCGLAIGVTLGVVAVLRWPLAAVVLGLGTLLVAGAWWRLGRSSGR